MPRAPFEECMLNATLMRVTEDCNTINPLTERVSTLLSLSDPPFPSGMHAKKRRRRRTLLGVRREGCKTCSVVRSWDLYFAPQEPLELHLHVCATKTS
ncbi:hypothetical protein CF326_g9458 [Tilletia indica]|nr:hypothetical protein CF326_g9458 [Tilletia indica]